MAWTLRSKSPPKTKTPRPYTAEEVLWWSVMNQAAKDLDRGNQSEAIDAYEFLEVTGRWLALTLFDIDLGKYDRELAARVTKRFRGASLSSLRR